MNLSLKGKTALVCGSSQGIGLAVAEELAELGAGCVLLARNERALQTACEKLSVAEGQQHSYAVADFSKPDEVQRVANDLVKQHRFEILINNTGGPAAGPITKATQQQFKDAYEQHLVVNHLLVQAVLPGMEQAGYGRIINIISTSVKIPLNNLGVSNTTRAAVAAWAKTLSNEIAAKGITVNNVLPGFTATARLKSLAQQLADQKQISLAQQEDLMRNEVPMQRFGTANEIAALAAFLASEAAAYITGTSIPVDGGRTGSF